MNDCTKKINWDEIFYIGETNNLRRRILCDHIYQGTSSMSEGLKKIVEESKVEDYIKDGYFIWLESNGIEQIWEKVCNKSCEDKDPKTKRENIEKVLISLMIKKHPPLFNKKNGKSELAEENEINILEELKELIENNAKFFYPKKDRAVSIPKKDGIYLYFNKPLKEKWKKEKWKKRKGKRKKEEKENRNIKKIKEKNDNGK